MTSPNWHTKSIIPGGIGNFSLMATTQIRAKWTEYHRGMKWCIQLKVQAREHKQILHGNHRAYMFSLDESLISRVCWNPQGGTSLLHWILPWHLARWVSRYDKGDSSQTARSYFLSGQILSPKWWGVYARNRPHLWTVRFSPTLGTDGWEGRVVRRKEEFSIIEDPEVTVTLSKCYWESFKKNSLKLH